jgi:molecular chaperone DnaJ
MRQTQKVRMADYYQLLQVPPDASAEDVKRAYRRLAREYHPDRNPDPGAREQMAEINRAYEVLSDPERRARYDRFGAEDEAAGGFAGSPFGAGGGLGDLFDAFFGGNSPFGGRPSGPSGPPRGVDLEATVDLEFADAVFGTQTEVQVRTAVACPDCDATGAAPGTSATTCPDCGGTGQVRRVRQSILGQMVTSGPCGRCGGAGQVIAERCPTCNGDGRTIDSRTYTVDVPAGVDSGTTLRLSGRGAVGPRGGAAGDLYVHLRVKPHERLRREGVDLHERLSISVAQAALGATISYETLDGTEELIVEAGTQSGEVLRLRAKGVPQLQGRGRGDLLVELAVSTPTDLSQEEEDLLRHFAELRGEDVAEADTGFLARIKHAFR